MEPWTWSDLTEDDLAAGTLSAERRRAHFEFVPVGFKPIAPEGSAPLAGPVLPGSERARGADLPSSTGELELRVTVSVERRFRPGYQSSPYTRALGGFSRDAMVNDADAKQTPAPRDRSTWTPIARDERLERVLIARIAELLTQSVDQ